MPHAVFSDCSAVKTRPKAAVSHLAAVSGIVEERFHCMAKGTFGERLKRERELREVKLEEISNATRISHRFLEALENEDWSRLPGGVFGRGFVRSIARYLGLNEESLLAEYDLARGEGAVSPQNKPEERIPSPPKWIPAVVLLVVLLVLAGLVAGGIYGWRKYKAHRLSKQSTASPASASPAAPVRPTETPAVPNATSKPAAAILLELSISTSTATRVRVVADNRVVLDRELPAGENRRFTATDHFEVTASDSSAVLLELNGDMMAPLGAPGSSGRIVLSAKDLRQVSGGVSQP
ncbi:MAG TPA: helix-turn-helix domain-containing protein [Candidatus Sulfotelmatobacter sp.]|nr:helix-turn-helix domain-containing protein [Candidatus Sulfotelmatobacter sp.]